MSTFVPTYTKLPRDGSSERGHTGTCSGKILFHGKYLYLQCYMTIFPLCGYTYALAQFTAAYRALIPLRAPPAMLFLNDRVRDALRVEILS